MASDRLLLYAVLGLTAVVLQGCELMGCSASKDTTTTPLPPGETSTSTITTTTTSLGPTTTSTKYVPSNPGHCSSKDSSGDCEKCDSGFGLVDGECFYTCETDVDSLSVVESSSKGLCLDDTTFQNCADEIPYIWPNTKEPVKSLRIFSSWQGFWPEEGREQAWDDLVKLVTSNNMKVLVGTQITCNETDDDRDWTQVMSLLKMLGAKHIMGVAIGNELELLWQKQYATKECIQNLWAGGYYWAKTKSRISDMDALGAAFEDIPVTSVFGGAILGGDPFVDTAQAQVLTYLKKAVAEYGSRWAFSLNVYPYLDPSTHLDKGSSNKCDESIKQCLCLDDPKCLSVAILNTMRTRMKTVSGGDDNLLWMGETGWSHPQASTLNTPAAKCPDFSSKDTFEENYKNFLSWDLSLPTSVKGPDHVFYFTMRDSNNFGFQEHFGLVGACGDTQCKLQSDAEDDVFRLFKGSMSSASQELEVVV